MEDRLKALYKLQTHLSEIDRITTIRGELPDEVKDLEDEIVRFQTRIQKHEEEIENLKNFINQKRGEIADREAKIERYNVQLDNVRNNREFAFLEKEKEFETLEIELASKKIRGAAADQEAKEQEIRKAEEDLADTRHILEEKRRELEEIVAETEKEEERLRGEVKKQEALIDDYTLAAFRRIRKNARNGLGIVTVQRNACGGCFNRVPPQRQLEIKMHKKVIVCEYCSRILIDGALVGLEEKAPENPKPSKRGKKA